MALGHFIAGQWVEGGATPLVSRDPVYGQVLWEGLTADQALVNQSINAARQAFGPWSHLSFDQRVEYLEKFSHLVNDEVEELAQIIAFETGKPLWESLGEAKGVVAKLAISKDAFENRTGSKMIASSECQWFLRHKPHGVIVVFGPFNFPAHIPNGQIIPALLAGNTVVFKPSDQVCQVAEWLLNKWAQADLPPGVINMVQGGPETGQLLVEHSEINGVFFTGSHRVGQIIHKALAGRTEVILALELGGNNPLIVDEVESINAAVYHTIQSAYITAGQRCVCARRLIVPKGAQNDRFIEALKVGVSGIRVAAYDANPEPFMGSVISPQQAQVMLKAQDDLLSQGAESVIKMKPLQADTGLLMPGLIDVTSIQDRQDNEWFGPLLQLIRVEDFDEAIFEANQTRFGLSAGLISENKTLFERFVVESQAGIVNWNRPMTGANSQFPFGGVGHSGNLRPGGYYMADSCAYPLASAQAAQLEIPAKTTPGLEVKLTSQ